VLAETGVRPPDPVAAGPPVGRGAVQDFDRERILDRLLVYERRIEHSLYRTMAELRLLRKEGEVSSLKCEEESLCETNPNCPGVSSLKSEVSSVLPTSHFTLAASDQAPEGGTPNVDGDESCETNPIGAGSNVDGTPNGADAQEPLCETNPICPGASGGQVPCGTGVRDDSPQSEVGETNPMCDRMSLRKEDAKEHILSGNLL